jgi:hypothetical protein
MTKNVTEYTLGHVFVAASSLSPNGMQLIAYCYLLACR